MTEFERELVVDGFWNSRSGLETRTGVPTVYRLTSVGSAAKALQANAITKDARLGLVHLSKRVDPALTRTS